MTKLHQSCSSEGTAEINSATKAREVFDNSHVNFLAMNVSLRSQYDQLVLIVLRRYMHEMDMRLRSYQLMDSSSIKH